MSNYFLHFLKIFLYIYLYFLVYINNLLFIFEMNYIHEKKFLQVILNPFSIKLNSRNDQNIQ